MELYVQRAAQRFGLPDGATVRRELRRGQHAIRGGEGEPVRRNLAAANEYGKLPRLQRDLVGVLLDRPALFTSPDAARIEGLLEPELRRVFRAAAAAAVQESGALDLTALFSALKDSDALAWVKERLALQVYRDRDDVEEALRNGIALLVKEHAERVQGLKTKIFEARGSGDDELANQLTRQLDDLRRGAAQGQARRER